ncbi:hypothetical protein [Bryobacter aggregatus]|uniref:hypothetical protein n=1 Tax=Bryobacter aggregatus TaxID=360054 RepID=UPI0004E171EB|nr:hypothetical protein [Bryobacter aggregatus]
MKSPIFAPLLASSLLPSQQKQDQADTAKIFLTGSRHSTETGNPEMLMELGEELPKPRRGPEKEK